VRLASTAGGRSEVLMELAALTLHRDAERGSRGRSDNGRKSPVLTTGSHASPATLPSSRVRFTRSSHNCSPKMGALRVGDPLTSLLTSARWH